MKSSNFIILFILYISISNSVYSQISGIIRYNNETSVELKSFDELYLELHYYPFSPERKKLLDPGEYKKVLNLEKLLQIDLIYETEENIQDFYYLLTIRGKRENNTNFHAIIKAWDWLEISSPEIQTKHNTRIILFHQEKKQEIDRIIFNFR